MVVVGVDVKEGKRWVLDVHNEASMHPDAVRGKVKEWTERYGINEWRIEENAFQKWLTRDTDLNVFLAGKGVVLTPHTTGNNKHDPNFGVMAMAGLFQQRMISLPNSNSEGVKALVEQLSVWQPDPPRGTKTDCVMALWFCELRAIELVTRLERTKYFRTTEFTTRGDKLERRVVTREDSDQGQEWLVNPQRGWWGR